MAFRHHKVLECFSELKLVLVYVFVQLKPLSFFGELLKQLIALGVRVNEIGDRAQGNNLFIVIYVLD